MFELGFPRASLDLPWRLFVNRIHALDAVTAVITYAVDGSNSFDNGIHHVLESELFSIVSCVPTSSHHHYILGRLVGGGSVAGVS